MSVRVVTALSLLGLGFAACRGGAERIDPAPTGSSSSVSSTSSGGEGGSLPIVRTIDVRSPWGGPAENLLVDGDFELSITVEGYGDANAWYAFTKSGTATRYLRAETGGLCRTGLRCGVLEPNTVLFGRGAAPPKGLGLVATVWARPPVGKGCEVVLPSLLDCDAATTSAKLKPVAKEPDASGWCSYTATVTKVGSKRCLYVDSKLASGESALVDSATMLATDAGGDASLVLPEPVDPDAAAVAQRVRGLLPFGRPRHDLMPSTP
ncbi:MAG: hypothetical protein FJ095_04260 [Deltaproteobacteria bacterium]|nr:hypothetical protein [Deltaproteobacteria bacterium]